MRASDKCHYPGCPRKRGRGWTTCGRHHTAGISIRQWNKRTEPTHEQNQQAARRRADAQDPRRP